MGLTFDKFHGLGNDFAVVEGTEDLLSTDEIVDLCRRHRGVGADGVLMVDPAVDEVPPVVRMVVYNRDGSRPEMCGNGVRCVAAYASRRWDIRDELVVESDAGSRRCRIETAGRRHWSVTVGMGAATGRTDTGSLTVDETAFDYVGVDVGNPHAIVFQRADVETVERIGRLANDDHPAFPEGVNVEFATREAEDRYRAVVYERGVGRTRACGTGACAVAEAVWRTDRVSRDRSVEVELPGGVLAIESRDDGLWMRGPARRVFTGVWRP